MTAPYLDTSVVAKWYLREPLSRRVERYLLDLPYGLISWLTTVEMSSLMARRRRAGEITTEIRARVLARFEQDIADGHLRVVSIGEEQVAEAIRVFDSLPGHSLRTLDALHLAVARRAGATRLATADRVMAAAAAELGFEVEAFVA